jgi:hypothetical protein
MAMFFLGGLTIVHNRRVPKQEDFQIEKAELAIRDTDHRGMLARFPTLFSAQNDIFR